MKNLCCYENGPLLSICIPTNGVLEWIRPVLESIYCQDVSTDFFEVLIACNGDNSTFDDFLFNKMKQYDNLYYKKTNEQGFMNQIACFKMAKGKFVKFLNHRMMMNDGSIEYLIDFIMANISNKPTIYYTNGNLKSGGKIITTEFDKYIYNLGIYSSWSGGIAFWNDEMVKECFEMNCNALFPHFCILLYTKNSSRYIVDDKKIMTEITTDTQKKSRYNFFFAFSIEYLSLLLDLYRKGLISISTLLDIKSTLKYWLADQCINFFILRNKTAYDLSGFPKSLLVFFNFKDMTLAILVRLMKRSFKKILNIFNWNT